MINLTRINLNTDGNRAKLIDFCLNNKNQCLAIGWSCVYNKGIEINNYESYYYAVQNYRKQEGAKDGKVYKTNHVHNVFRDSQINDLFWTRDLNGYYWICRVIDKSKNYYDYEMDIGAILPVEAYKFDIEVPGQIKAAFNRKNGGVSQDITDELIINYSKKIYNEISNNEIYEIKNVKGSIIDNLPDFELEELVITYLQIIKNYYVLSNSIANKSTTIKIECELLSREKNNVEKAVVQVKAKKADSIDALSYQEYVKRGYKVYFYAPSVLNINSCKQFVKISEKDLLEFYNEYKNNLPLSITKWENLLENKHNDN